MLLALSATDYLLSVCMYMLVTLVSPIMLVTAVSCTKMAELIEVRFGL